MATDSSSDDSDHQDHHHLDQGEHNSDAGNDNESGSDSGSDTGANSEASSDSDDSSDEVSSSEVLTRNSRGIQLLASMLDLEASESHSSDDEHDDDGHDESDLAEHIHEYSNSRQARRNDHQSFPKFARLPYELRQRVWEMFCPDLTAKSRVYEFQIIITYPTARYTLPCDAWENHILEQQTAPVRVMSAVHRESREHVLKKLPDVLTFRKGRNMVRWNRENDIVMLCGRALPPFPQIPGFSDQIRNLALDVEFKRYLDYIHETMPLPEPEKPSLGQTLGTFCPNMNRAFVVSDDCDCSVALLRWCAAKDGHHYFVRTEEEEPGVGEDADYVYCWPSTKSRKFVPDSFMPWTLGNQSWRSPESARRWLEEGDNDLQPLIRFSFDSGLRRFEKLVKKVKKHGDNPAYSTLSETESDDEHEHEEPDEYESSGIDDSEISEDEEGGSRSEDDLVVVADDTDHEEEDSSDEGGPTHAGHSDQSHDGPIEIIDDSDDESLSGSNTHHHQPGPSDAARFSSIEPSDSSTMDEESSSPHRARPSRSAGSRRKRVLEWDSDEEEEHDGPPRKAARIGNESRRRGRATVVLSDDEDEEMEYESIEKQRESPQSASGGGSPGEAVVISDDDEDEEEEEVARRRLKRKAMHRPRMVPDEDEEDEEEEEEEEKVPMPRKIRSRRGLRPPASNTDDDEDEESESSTSDSDDSSEDDDDAAEAPTKPLTLAEKLELHRRDNPIPDSDDDSDNDDGSVSGDDYDARNYADFQDDEEGNEISGEDEEDDEEGEGGLIMDMADEEDEEDEY
ncbi:hypothetical protein QBC45DRAFT_368634 [Copromyces sp. CBS 386.78]|nr:hypothetical protein QBC45DRAFT_368634 [Copromyces sp. CBS 386.78]